MLVAKGGHEGQQGESQQRACITVAARIAGLKIRIVNLRQKTPFPSGTMVRRTVGIDRHARRLKAAMRLESNGIRKREAGDAGRKEQDSARDLPRIEAQ
jgi:hypothetical protein